jgi:hypothetical protein
MSIFLTLIDINICRLKTEMKQNSCLKLCCSGGLQPSLRVNDVDNSETLSTVLHFDPIHSRISRKNNPEKS